MTFYSRPQFLNPAGGFTIIPGDDIYHINGGDEQITNQILDIEEQIVLPELIRPVFLADKTMR